MSFNGYVIENAGTKLAADLCGPNFTPETRLIIYHLNHEGGTFGTRNQNWRVLPADAGRNLFVIQSVLTGSYVAVDGPPQTGKQIVSSLTSSPWEITVLSNTSRNYTVKVPNTNLVWSVPASAPELSTITISEAESDNKYQQWRFKAVI